MRSLINSNLGLTISIFSFQDLSVILQTIRTPKISQISEWKFLLELREILLVVSFFQKRKKLGVK